MKKRVFESGGIRDSGNHKHDPYGFRNPLCEHSFYSYMYHHRKLKDGSMRDPNNWWKGWDREISLKSMSRHVEDLKCIHAGYFVYKEFLDDGEKTHVFTEKPLEIPSWWHEVTEEECCNAIDFNTNAYKLEVLKNDDEYAGRLLAWDEDEKAIVRTEVVREVKMTQKEKNSCLAKLKKDLGL